MPGRKGYSKTERLKSRKQIDELFAKGKSFSVFPIKTVYRFEQNAESAGLKGGVTASKRFFKKAVDRNRIKRLLREAYRLQKEQLQQQAVASQLQGSIFFIYTDKVITDFETIKAAMDKSLSRLVKIINSETSS